MTVSRPLDEKYDSDLWPLRDDAPALDAALSATCVCGHSRREHYAATGAIGSFGGSACESCWSCGTFTSVNNPARAPEKGVTSTVESSQQGAAAAPAETPEQKEKRDPTRYHVLRMSGDVNGGKSWEQLTKSPVGASSATQAIELALGDGHGNGTYVAVPERSFAPKKVTVEKVETQKVVVA